MPQNVTVSINNGESSTTNTKVSLKLSATDNSGVSAYYASESNSAPASSTNGWQTLKPRNSYLWSEAVYSKYRINLRNLHKTVYVWFKDAKGNISNSVMILFNTFKIRIEMHQF